MLPIGSISIKPFALYINYAQRIPNACFFRANPRKALKATQLDVDLRTLQCLVRWDVFDYSSSGESKRYLNHRSINISDKSPTFETINRCVIEQLGAGTLLNRHEFYGARFAIEMKNEHAAASNISCARLGRIFRLRRINT